MVQRARYAAGRIAVALRVHLRSSPSHPIRPHAAPCQTPGMDTASTKTISRRDATKIIGVSPDTLKKWSIEGRGPLAIKLGSEQQSRTLYSLAEIEAWQRDPAAYERRGRGSRP